MRDAELILSDSGGSAGRGSQCRYACSCVARYYRASGSNRIRLGEARRFISEDIVDTANEWLAQNKKRQLAHSVNPFGDGHSGDRIAEMLASRGAIVMRPRRPRNKRRGVTVGRWTPNLQNGLRVRSVARHCAWKCLRPRGNNGTIAEGQLVCTSCARTFPIVRSDATVCAHGRICADVRLSVEPFRQIAARPPHGK